MAIEKPSLEARVALNPAATSAKQPQKANNREKSPQEGQEANAVQVSIGKQQEAVAVQGYEKGGAKVAAERASNAKVEAPKGPAVDSAAVSSKAVAAPKNEPQTKNNEKQETRSDQPATRSAQTAAQPKVAAESSAERPETTSAPVGESQAG